ncbi:hypothetical protein [Streptomyces sp. AC602_WCS936]|uniref:hypothetical protein n=1 Tax=Streptomyces sp. AC602_WCS936 TaxID=2823685 RepID=UPI0020B6EB31|nr:hypothetical protein [Streptomyces sp. AC602_WCS936]
MEWGATDAERSAAKAFVLDVLDLAARRHRWGPADAGPGDELPDAPLVACCVRHRVLSALPYWEGCVFCHG